MSTPIRTLNGTATKVRDPETSTTEKQDVVTQKIRHSWRTNPDGTPNEPLINQYNDDLKSLQEQYHIDPTTGNPDKKYVSDILGINPDKMRAQRESEQELNRRKQKESAWYNALAVLGDMVTTAAGGNVWKREKTTIAKDAAERNLQLQKEQTAEDAAIHKAGESVRQAYHKAAQGLKDAYDKTYGWETSVTSGGGSTTKKSGGREVSTTQRQVLDNEASRSARATAGGGGSPWVMNVNIKSKDGTIVKRLSYEIGEQKFIAVANLLKSYYTQKMNEKDGKGNLTPNATQLKNALLAHHVLKRVKDPISGREQYEYDEKELMQNGDYWIMGDEALKRRIEQETNGQIRFSPSQGYNPDEQTANQETQGGL